MKRVGVCFAFLLLLTGFLIAEGNESSDASNNSLATNETSSEEIDEDAVVIKRPERILLNSNYFSLSETSLEGKLKQGEVIGLFFTIENLDSKERNFKLSSSSPFISLPSDVLIQGKGIEGIQFYVRVDEEVFPGIYVTKVHVESEEEILEVLVSIIVDSKIVPYELQLEFDKGSLNVSAGDDLIFNLSVIKIEAKTDNMVLSYIIKDGNGKVMFESTEEQIIKDYITELNGKIAIPDHLVPGEYIFYARAENEGNFASTSTHFTVLDEGKRITIWLYSFLTLVIFTSTFVLIFFLKKKREKRMFIEKYNPSGIYS